MVEIKFEVNSRRELEYFLEISNNGHNLVATKVLLDLLVSPLGVNQFNENGEKIDLSDVAADILLKMAKGFFPGEVKFELLQRFKNSNDPAVRSNIIWFFRIKLNEWYKELEEKYSPQDGFMENKAFANRPVPEKPGQTSERTPLKQQPIKR